MKIKFLLLLLLLILARGATPLAPIIEPGFKLRGKVSDEHGSPLEYANVTLQQLNMTSVTGAGGYYEFANIPAGKYLVTAKRTGYQTKSFYVELLNQDVELDFVLTETLIETPEIEVTASFKPSKIEEVPVSVTSLEGKSLIKEKSQTLARTIADVPGVSNLSTGNSVGKPVIRGLTSNAVIIVKDGVKQESQQWGDEHGSEIDLADVERIEILRGPSSLLYGADGIGGVINIVSKSLLFGNKKPVYYGELNTGGFSVNRLLSGGLRLGAGLRNFGVSGHLELLRSGNVRTPEGTFVVQTPEGERTISGGELSNSASDEIRGGLRLGFNGNFGTANASVEGSLKHLQIHEDPVQEPGATPNQRVLDGQFQINGIFNLNKNLKLEPVFSYSLNSRKEFESAEQRDVNNPSIDLGLGTYEAATTIHHEFKDNVSGSTGAMFVFQRNRTLGEEKLIPNYNSLAFGIYHLQRYKVGKFTFSAGLRFDRKQEVIKHTVFDSGKVVNDQTLSFNAFSGSIGGSFSPIEPINLFANLGSGWRPPSEVELFVDGVHEGTGRYEVGIRTTNPGVKVNPEQSINLDAGVRLNYKIFAAEITVFHNLLNNFIYPARTGRYFIQIDPETQDTTAILPVFQISQARSVFLGYEYRVQIQALRWLTFSVSGDYVRTRNDATGSPLPFTPSAKNIVELRLQGRKLGRVNNPYLSFKAKFVSPQNRVDLLEAKTNGYTLLTAGAGAEFLIGKSIVSADFSVDNLLDTKYVDHLSRYRYYALNPGRSFNLKISMPFQVTFR
jgi:iron complex outermembrane receptor protein